MTEEQLIEQILKITASRSPFILGIDGRCASGKSTFARMLSEQSTASVIHLDSFFPQPFQRTPERLAEPGGNLDRERFIAEVVEPIRSGKPFLKYRVYNCSTQTLQEEIRIDLTGLIILEGSYSCRPEFRGVCDLTLFLTVSPEEQMRRITQRNGREAAETFKNRWIPMEERYFSFFRIPEVCDGVYNTETEELSILSDRMRI